MWELIGGMAFGAVVGWITYFILRRAQPKSLSDLSTVIGVLGGATITGLFSPTGSSFVGYAIGLFLGFFVYFILFWAIVGWANMKQSLIASLNSGMIVMGPNQEKAEGETTMGGTGKNKIPRE